eukprot:Awhi_evm1s1405
MGVGRRDENGCVPDCEGKQLAIPHTSEYKYLGIMVNEKWDCHKESQCDEVTPESHLVKQVQVFKSSFRGPRRSSDK